MIKGCNIFLGSKTGKHLQHCGCIIVQQEKLLRADRSWTNLLHVLQEAIHYSFIKFWIYCFSFWYEFFVQYALRVKKNYQHGLHAGPLEFQFLRLRGCLTNPFRTLSLCFGITGRTPGLISRNNFVKKISVCIGHHDNVLARCDSIFPLLRCQGVWNKKCTQLSLSEILFQNLKNSWGCSKILLSFLMRFDDHFLTNQQQQQYLPQFKSILDGHLSRHLLPSPVHLKIENTT